MYTAASPSAPPATGPAATPAVLAIGSGLARVEHLLLGEGRPFGWDDHIYFPDLMRSYGIDCRADFFEGRRNSFTDMTEAILPRLGPFADRFDVAILTGATTDSQPGFPMSRLSELVPDAGLAFAVFDQGVLAPFTALRLAVATVGADRAERAGRAMLLIMDQSTVLHDLPITERLRPDHDSVVALVLDPAGDLGTVRAPRSVAVSAAVSAESAAACVADELAAELAGARNPAGHTALVCGLGLAARLPRALPVEEVLRPEPGLPATGIWALFAAHLPRWRTAGARVVLADLDEDQGRLDLCVIDVAGQRPERAPA